MNKIDKRRHYIMVCDTETANTQTMENGRLDMSNVLVYDCGWAVVDTHGTIYETASYVNRDIFVKERELMRTAYYANKIPRYVDDLRAGSRRMATTYEIKDAMRQTIEKYGIKHVAAHNARFDYNALNNTQRYITKSAFRYWFPFGVEIWDTMKMARDVIHKMPTYQQFCADCDLYSSTGGLSTTAENLYRFITKDATFEESHTALEDVLIEAAILAYCFRQHKPMRKKLWEDSKEFPPQTDIQRQIMRMVKEGNIR